MIKVDAHDFAPAMKAGLDGLALMVTDKAFANAAATSLAAGAKIISQRAKSLAPKGGRSKKGQTKTYGKTGLLKKSISVKKGVNKKGGPFAVVGPSASVSESVRRGQKTILQRPAYYSHLVEDGFRAHHRVPLVTGRQGDEVKRGVLWKGSDLQNYIKKNRIAMSALTKGKLARTKAFLAKGGQGSTTVAGQKFMAKAWAASSGTIGPVIVMRLEAETAKALKRLEAKAAKAAKASPGVR